MKCHRPWHILFSLLVLLTLKQGASAQKVPGDFTDPPRIFSVMPFWFWNDTLKDTEIVRQIADFEKHGVYGFVIHPRIGLPGSVSWLGPAMIHAMHTAVEEAARRKMYVVLYDEGMYPSGSSSGQVVGRDPAFAARGLAAVRLKEGEELQLPAGSHLVTTAAVPGTGRVAVIDKPSGGTIRGLHYIGEGKSGMKEEAPPAADILNPGAVKCFTELVYDRYAAEFGQYFGSTIIGIFTDEPGILGRGSEKGMVPGSLMILPGINRILGYDFTPWLPHLFYDLSPETPARRADYYRAVNTVLGETYYRALGRWCSEHGIALMGHPAGSMDIGLEKYFGIPGQDLVWRYVEPGPKALYGEHSTMAKCASSAMVHLGLIRNSNELYGAYGHKLTWEEMNWLAAWCFIRGQNMLFPHAFYYSVRGPRLDERPPDVGPNSPWWDRYRSYADACRRLSWINTGSGQVCSLAILCGESLLPEGAARTFYRNQTDFNYLTTDELWEKAVTDKRGIHISGMDYSTLVIDSLAGYQDKISGPLRMLAAAGRLIVRNNPELCSRLPGAVSVTGDDDLMFAVRRFVTAGMNFTVPSPGLRLRHVTMGKDHYYLLFNEEDSPADTGIEIPFNGRAIWLDPYTGTSKKEKEPVHFKPGELKILLVRP